MPKKKIRGEANTCFLKIYENSNLRNPLNFSQNHHNDKCATKDHNLHPYDSLLASKKETVKIKRGRKKKKDFLMKKKFIDFAC